MEMKYFRFLYGEIGSFMVHFGEITDTRTEQHFAFLYVRTVEKPVEQNKTEHTLFLCPKQVDMVVFDVPEEEAEEALAALEQKGVKIGTFVVSGTIGGKMREMLAGKSAVQTVVSVADTYQAECAGWQIWVRQTSDKRLALAHNLAGHERRLFDDCVMSVKAVGRGCRCRSEEKPDTYGCALGCTLDRDYDICKYSRKNASGSWPAGTMILSGTECDETLWRGAGIEKEGIRFFVLPPESKQSFRPDGENEASYKRYYIGAGSEIGDRTISDIVRSGYGSVPVVLGAKRGLCCSGLFKYTEK